MRSRVVAEHLIAEGHQVKMAASGQALPYFQEYLPDVQEIWGLSFVLEHGQVEAWKTLSKNVRGALRGVPEDWQRGVELARAFAPEVVITDFDGFTYLYAKVNRVRVVSVGNIQMVDRCRHGRGDPARDPPPLPRGTGVRWEKAPAGRPLPDHDVLPPAIRKKRTALVPSILRPEILAARRQTGSTSSSWANQRGIDGGSAGKRRTVPRLRARDALTADVEDGNLLYRPFSNEVFIDDLRTCRGVVASAASHL
jgi:hypothetical protein